MMQIVTKDVLVEVEKVGATFASSESLPFLVFRIMDRVKKKELITM